MIYKHKPCKHRTVQGTRTLIYTWWHTVTLSRENGYPDSPTNQLAVSQFSEV